jgi:hypothetical protein
MCSVLYKRRDPPLEATGRDFPTVAMERLRMSKHTLPREISAANALQNWTPPSSAEMRNHLVWVRVATRAMQLAGKIGDLSDFSPDEAEGIMSEIAAAIETFADLARVCIIGYTVLDLAFAPKKMG